LTISYNALQVILNLKSLKHEILRGPSSASFENNTNLLVTHYQPRMNQANDHNTRTRI